MPYVALDEHRERVYVAAHTKANLRARYRDPGTSSSTFTCPACQQAMTIVIGEQVTPHFRHLPSQPCTFEGHAVSQTHLDAQSKLFEFFTQTLKLAHVAVEAPISMAWRPRGRIADVLLGRIGHGSMVIEVQISPISATDLHTRTTDYHRAGVDHVAWIFDTPQRMTHFAQRTGRYIQQGYTSSYHELGQLNTTAVNQPMNGGLYHELFDMYVSQLMKHAGEQPDTEQLAEELLGDPEQGFMFWPLLDKGVLPTAANLMLWTTCMRLKKALTQAESDLTTTQWHLAQAAETTRKMLKRCQGLENRLEQAQLHARSKQPTAFIPPHLRRGELVLSVERILQRSRNGVWVTYLSQGWFPTHHVRFSEDGHTMIVPHWLAEDKGLLEAGKLSRAPGHLDTQARPDEQD